jgi:hypothetical protein
MRPLLKASEYQQRDAGESGQADGPQRPEEEGPGLAQSGAISQTGNLQLSFRLGMQLC